MAPSKASCPSRRVRGSEYLLEPGAFAVDARGRGEMVELVPKRFDVPTDPVGEGLGSELREKAIGLENPNGLLMLA